MFATRCNWCNCALSVRKVYSVFYCVYDLASASLTTKNNEIEIKSLDSNRIITSANVNKTSSKAAAAASVVFYLKKKSCGHDKKSNLSHWKLLLPGMWHTVCVCLLACSFCSLFTIYNWTYVCVFFFVLKLLTDNFSGTWPSFNTQYKYSIFVSFSIENKENELYDWVGVSLHMCVLEWSMKVAYCFVLFYFE